MSQMPAGHHVGPFGEVHRGLAQREIERTGLKFYRHALRKLKDPNSQGLLKFLVKEEEEHLAFYMGWYFAPSLLIAMNCFKSHSQ